MRKQYSFRGENAKRNGYFRGENGSGPASEEAASEEAASGEAAATDISRE